MFKLFDEEESLYIFKKNPLFKNAINYYLASIINLYKHKKKNWYWYSWFLDVDPCFPNKYKHTMDIFRYIVMDITIDNDILKFNNSKTLILENIESLVVLSFNNDYYFLITSSSMGCIAGYFLKKSETINNNKINKILMNLSL